jgi:O-antigen/teichoic acid export membrane protein
MGGAQLFPLWLLAKTSASLVCSRILAIVVLFVIIGKHGTSQSVESFLIASSYTNSYIAFQSLVIFPLLLARSSSDPGKWTKLLRRVSGASTLLGVLLCITHVFFAEQIAGLLSAEHSNHSLVQSIRWTGLILFFVIVAAPARVVLSLKGKTWAPAVAPSLSWLLIGVAAWFFPMATDWLIIIQAAVFALEAGLMFYMCAKFTPELGGVTIYDSSFWKVLLDSKWLVATFIVNLSSVTLDLAAAAWCAADGVSTYQAGTRFPFMASFGLSSAMSALIGLAATSGLKDRLSRPMLGRIILNALKVSSSVGVACATIPAVLWFYEPSWLGHFSREVLVLMGLGCLIIPLSSILTVQSRFFDLYNIQKKNLDPNFVGLLVRAVLLAPLTSAFGLKGVMIVILIGTVSIGARQHWILRKHQETDILSRRTVRRYQPYPRRS